MFNKKIKNKIKLLNKDKEAYPASSWLKKDKEQIKQFMADNPVSVRKEIKQSRNIIERVDFSKLNAQKQQEFAFLGLNLSLMKIKTIIASFLLAAILIGGGASAVSAKNSLPGEALYPVKLAAEKVQLVLTSDKGDVKLHAKFASKRAYELKELVSQAELDSTLVEVELIRNTASKLKNEIESSEKGLTALSNKGEDVAELALEVEEKANQQVQTLEDVTSLMSIYQDKEKQSAIDQTKQAVKQSQINTLKIISQTGKNDEKYPEAMKSRAEERINVRLEEATIKIKSVVNGGENASYPKTTTKNNEPITIEGKIEQVKNINIILNEIENSETQDNKIIPGGGGGGLFIPIEPDNIEPISPYDNQRMTMEEAVKIAWSNPECIQYGLETDTGSYNSQTHTWWFNLKYKTDTCDYACVVYTLERRAEVYPMCRGLILPKGDVNKDGKVNSTDALIIMSYLDGLTKLTKEQLDIADVTQDNKVTKLDADVILAFDVGILSSLPILYGDVDGDGKITDTDADLIMQYDVNAINLNSSQLYVADVNLDETVNSTDGLIISSYVQGIINNLPLTS